MADSFLYDFAGDIVKRAASVVEKEIVLAVRFKSELNEFVKTLSTIKAVLLDAEEQRVKSHQVKVWLERLEDVCSDAEDMLDEFEYETLRQQVVSTHGSLKMKVRNFFSHSNLEFRRQMAHKLQGIRDTLNEIARDRHGFHLMERVGDGEVMHMDRETYSSVSASKVIGRDADREKIIPLLMCSDDENVSVIPIVGMGGQGKTTLAKVLYNDNRVVGHFQLRIWVCVSEDFKLKKVIKTIINSAANADCGDLNLNQMTTLLQTTLKDKLFLLILDDVWNEDPQEWNNLRDLLNNDVNGSKIIVTTRSQSVASIVSTTPRHKLEGLSPEECMSLFENWAFTKGEKEKYPNLLKIGGEIVKKCGGVPLAVKTLGSLLRLKRDERDWLKVKDSEVWKLEQKENDILPALRLSYNYLPSYLKKCFAFCSIFPKDYKLSSLELIRLWIAEGLLKSSDDNPKLEDIGHQYIKELYSRSFFQNVEEYGIALTFEMHDLVHDLASLVAQKVSLGKNNRHVSISGYLPLEELKSSLPKENNVRTIIFPTGGATSESFAKTCIARFKYLRVLDLRDSHFEVLPSSIGNLNLLRYLNLCNSAIKKLPNSICDLLNLQTLDLSSCLNLEKLPRDIGNLINLRCLYITTRQMFFKEEGIGRLKSLQFLGIDSCNNLKSLGEGVQHLTALQTLLIGNCRSLESLPHGMKYLTALETLFLYNCQMLNLMEWEADIQGVNFNLRSSWIVSLPQLEALPQWLQGSANTLEQICIADCQKLTALPEWLQNLTSLQKLVIEDCPKLSALPEGMRSLTALQELKIKNCLGLRGRCKQGTGEDWTKIAHVAKIDLDKETSDEVGTSESRND